MVESSTYICDNCGIEVKQENAVFETSVEDFRPGFEYDTPIADYETVLCSKCYDTYKIKSDRSSYGEPDIDTSVELN